MNQRKMRDQSSGLYFVILFVLVLIGNSRADEDDMCKQPLPKDVDPVKCCKLPDSIDRSIVEKCSSRTFGLEDMHRGSSDEPAFVPHFRVNSERIYEFLKS